MERNENAFMSSPKVRVEEEFRDLLGPLKPDVEKMLEESMKVEQCRDPLVVWRQEEGPPILLDGHHRYAICERRGIGYRTVNCPESVSDRRSALIWISQNQRARRNLTKNELKVVGGMMYRQEKGNQGGDRKSTAQNAHLKDTAERIGKHFGVDGSTIRRWATFSEELDKQPPEIRAKILSGEMKLPRSLKPQSPQEAANPKEGDRVPASNEGENAKAVAEQGTGPKTEQGSEAKAEPPAVCLSLPSARPAAKAVSIQVEFDNPGLGVMDGKDSAAASGCANHFTALQKVKVDIREIREEMIRCPQPSEKREEYKRRVSELLEELRVFEDELDGSGFWTNIEQTPPAAPHEGEVPHSPQESASE